MELSLLDLTVRKGKNLFKSQLNVKALDADSPQFHTWLNDFNYF